MEIVHPVADEWTDEYAVFVASSRSVLLTEPLAAFLDYAVTEHLRPILLTDAQARLSAFVSLAMRRAGGFWAVRGPEGVHDGLSGYRVQSFSGLWQPEAGERPRLPSFRTLAQDPRAVLLFDVFVHQRAAAETSIGGLSAALVESLGGDRPDVWDTHEPLGRPWSEAALTETARRGMPTSAVMHTRGPDGSFCDVTVGRTRHGLLEQAKGGVPIGGYPSGLGEVLRRAGDALATVADRFRPTIGFVSLAEFDAGVVQAATAKRPEVPLAVLIGPRGVHDLGVDVDALAGRHDVVRLGRPRLPSLLVRFSQPDQGLWAQLMTFAHDLGLDRVAELTGRQPAGAASSGSGRG